MKRPLFKINVYDVYESVSSIYVIDVTGDVDLLLILKIVLSMIFMKELNRKINFLEISVKFKTYDLV